MARSGEYMPPACGFRRRAENIVRQTFPRWKSPKWCVASLGATPELARGTRTLPIPVSVFGLSHEVPDIPTNNGRATVGTYSSLTPLSTLQETEMRTTSPKPGA